MATDGAVYCQGHLLNERLGGPGAGPVGAQNLTAFPQKPTNSDHNNGIEEFIKAATRNHWFRYEVAIDYVAGDAAKLGRRVRLRQGAAALAAWNNLATGFSYAARLTARWEELRPPGHGQRLLLRNNPPALTNGQAGSLDLKIPSPTEFVRSDRRAGEYPQGKTRPWAHLPLFKGKHEAVRSVMPTGGNQPPGAARLTPLQGRTFEMSQRRLGGMAASVGVTRNANWDPIYLAGYDHYCEGQDDARRGLPLQAGKLGHNYVKGWNDYHHQHPVIGWLRQGMKRLLGQ